MGNKDLSAVTGELVNAKRAFLPVVSLEVIQAVRGGNSKAVESAAGAIAIACPDLSALELLRSMAVELGKDC